MEILKGVLIGAARGMAELLPLSYSGHQVLKQTLFVQISGGKEEDPLFSFLLHLGLLFSVTFVLRKELLSVLKNLIHKFRFLLKQKHLPPLEPSFLGGGILFFFSILGAVFLPPSAGKETLPFTVVLLAINGAFLTNLNEFSNKPKPLSLSAGAALGGARFLSFLPGLSRTGGTLFAGQALGLGREKTLALSFLLFVPEWAVALIREGLLLGKRGGGSGEGLLLWVVGGICCAAAGVFGIRLTFWLVRRKRMNLLAYYSWAVAILLLIVWLRG